MQPATEGFLLLSPSLKPIQASPGAMEILTFPEEPADMKALDSRLAQKIETHLLRHSSSSRQSGFVVEFTSGRRSYSCRAFYLNSQSTNGDDTPSVALVIERTRRISLDLFQAAEQFHLTLREREVVQYLMQGLTSKEIAVRMKISTHTVKAFLRSIMMKMGASTRSGIIGRIFAVSDCTQRTGRGCALMATP